MIIGTDGYKSIVRRYVNHNQPYANFVGYLLWVGIVEEEEILAKHHPSIDREDVTIMNGPDEDIFFRIITPGLDGATNQGHCQLGMHWFDNSYNNLLQTAGAVLDNQVPQAVYNHMIKRVESHFHEPWISARNSYC